MGMRLFDTMTRSLREVETNEPGHVKIYTCGPTVYARAHIGNFRTFVFEDVLRRWLERRFDKVTHVMNLTDVDDRLIKNATEHGVTLDEETAPWIAGFFEDVDALGIRRAHHYPQATQYIDQMLDLIDKLEEKGAAYRSEGSVYFRLSAFPQYGRLSGAHARELSTGASGRIDADDYDKEDVRDFALWKNVGPEEIGWDTRLGRGHPGWHIECSAMSMTLLGEQIDIHCGGVDNIFPHHENEIAQSEAATGKPFVKLWAHSEHLRIGGDKMAKRLGNYFTLHEILEKTDVRPSAVRYLLAATVKYNKVLNYSDDSLHMATENVDKLVAFNDRITALATTGAASEEISDGIAAASTAFAEALDDDLNLPEAMGAVFTALRDINRVLDTLDAVDAATQLQLQGFIATVDDVLGILDLVKRERSAPLAEDDERLLGERQAARDARDFATSDRLRDELASRGIAVEDTAQGQRWKRA